MPRVAPALLLQFAAASIALAAVALAPPTEGEVLLIPLTGQSADSTAVWATGAGARIVGRGPLPGSLAVQGRTRSLIGMAVRHATLIVSAPPTVCGTRR